MDTAIYIEVYPFSNVPISLLLPGHQPVSLVSPAEPLVQHSQGLEECPCKEGPCKNQGKRPCTEGPCKDQSKRPCKGGGCQLQGDQGRGEEDQEQGRRDPKEQGVEKAKVEVDGDVLVRVRYRGETRLLRPRGGKLELDSLQNGLQQDTLQDDLPDTLKE